MNETLFSLWQSRHENPSPLRYVSFKEAQVFAHNITALALRKKIIKRPRHCEHCHKAPISTLHGHHPNYAKPLDVIWLCKRCHQKEHARIKRENMIPTFVRNYKNMPQIIERCRIVGQVEVAEMLSFVYEILTANLPRWPEIELLCKLP